MSLPLLLCPVWWSPSSEPLLSPWFDSSEDDDESSSSWRYACISWLRAALLKCAYSSSVLSMKCPSPHPDRVCLTMNFHSANVPWLTNTGSLIVCCLNLRAGTLLPIVFLSRSRFRLACRSSPATPSFSKPLSKVMVTVGAPLGVLL